MKYLKLFENFEEPEEDDIIFCAKYEYEKALKKLDDLGFSKKHRYFKILKETYDIFESRAKQIIQKSNGKYNLKFDFELGWYASGGRRLKDSEITKSGFTYSSFKKSISCYVSFATNSELYDMFYDEYWEQRKKYKKYKYGFSKKGFYADKQQEISTSLNLPFKVSGGGNAYSYSGNRVFLSLYSGELD